MKILTVAPHYSPTGGYGLNRYVCGLSNGLAGAGHDVHLLTVTPDGRSSDRDRQGVDVHLPSEAWPLFHYERDANTVLENIRLIGRGLELPDGSSPFDLVSCHGWEGALASNALKDRLGVPMILHLHGTEVGRRMGKLTEPEQYVAEMERWACGRAQAVLCPSEIVKREALQFYGVGEDRLFVLRPAPDPSRFDPGETNLEDFRALIAGPDELVVLFAGELSEHNGPQLLVDAASSVLERTGAVHFVFAGEGDMAVELMKKAQEAGVAERCLFVGRVSDRVLGCLHSCCDVLAAPALYAPSGMSAIECMAQGTPAVASGTGVLSDLIADGRNGLKVAPNDPDALAGSVVWLVKNRERIGEMGLAAQQGIKGSRTWERSALEFAQIVRFVIRSGQTRE